MNRLFKLKFNKKIIFSSIYMYFFIISFLIIPAGDDFFWWGKSGHYLLTHNFYGLDPSFGGSSNGRYLGNIFEILMMHSPIFAAIFYASVITTFIWCLWYLTGRNKISLILALSFFITLQSGYIQSVFMWFAGFINYLPPIILLLLYCIMINKYIKTNYSLPSIAFFILAFVGGLFVEHMTLYQIFVGILSLSLITFLNKYKRFNLSPNITYAYTLGAIASAILMFSNPSYYSVKNNYREVSLSINSYFNSFIKTTHFWIVTFNYFVIALICLSLIMIAIKEIKNKQIKYTIIALSTFFVLYYLSVNLYISLVYKIDYINYQIPNINYNFALVDSLISILFFLFLIIATLFLTKGFDIYFYLLSTVALFIPFLFILLPIFVREYFSSFVFLFILGIIYANRAVSAANLQGLIHKLFKPMTVLVVIFYVLVMFMMVANFQSNMSRVKDPSFLYETKTLKYKVPYPNYVSQNDLLMMQSPLYWQNRLNYKFKDYFYNGTYK